MESPKGRKKFLALAKFSTSCRASHCLVVVIENEKKLKLKINQSSTSNGLALPGEGGAETLAREDGRRDFNFNGYEKVNTHWAGRTESSSLINKEEA